MVSESLKAEKMLRCVLMAVIAVFFAAFCAVNFLGFDLLTDNWMQADTQLAKLMWEQKTLLPKGWVFGDVIHTVTPTVLCALLYGLTKSINLSMALSMAVFTLVLMFAVYWFLTPFAGRTRRLAAICAMFAFVICFNPARQFLFYYSGFFISSLITMLVVWGDYLRAFKDVESGTITPGFVFANILAYFTGMQSPMQTVLMVAPLWLFEIVRLIKFAVENRGRPTQKQFVLTVRLVCYTISNLAGVWQIRSFNYVQKASYEGISMSDGAGLWQRIKNLMSMVAGILGLGGEMPVFIRLIILPLSLLGIAAVVLTLVYGIKTSNRRNGVWFGVVFCCLSCLCAGTVTLMFDLGANTQLFVAWYAAVAFSAAYIIKAFGKEYGKKALAVIIAASLLNALISYAPTAATAMRTGEYSLNRETVSETA